MNKTGNEHILVQNSIFCFSHRKNLPRDFYPIFHSRSKIPWEFQFFSNHYFMLILNINAYLHINKTRKGHFLVKKELVLFLPKEKSPMGFLSHFRK